MDTYIHCYDRVGKRARHPESPTEGPLNGGPGRPRNPILPIQERRRAERPREQILAEGASRLSDRELLEAILGSGVSGHPVSILANQVLDALDSHKGETTAALLADLPGLGKAKAALLCAMLEFGRRRWGAYRRRIRLPEDAWQVVRHLGDRQQEHFVCISLNGAHELIASRIVSVGLVNRTVVHPREIFADPIVDRASAVILAHNHPSGSLDPSSEDDEVTSRLREAGALIGIEVIDHLIFSTDGFYSYLSSQRLH